MNPDVTTNPPSPGTYRAFTVRNHLIIFPEFYQKACDAMQKILSNNNIQLSQDEVRELEKVLNSGETLSFEV